MRTAKELNVEQMNMISGGVVDFDFIKNEKKLDDEFYMMNKQFQEGMKSKDVVAKDDKGVLQWYVRTSKNY